MTREDFDSFFANYPQFNREAWLSISRPCIDIEFSLGQAQSYDSYFGGTPYLPTNFILPETPKGNRYNFIGQINFADVPRQANVGSSNRSMSINNKHNYSQYLPESGLLSLFYLEYADDWDFECPEPFWGDEGYIKAFYFVNMDGFSLHVDKTTDTSAQKLKFAQGLSLPASSYLNVTLPEDDSADEFYQLAWQALDLGQAHLFGYPAFDSLGYDPTPIATGEDWIPFINISSHDSLQWCWHDGDKLMTFIEKSALRNHDFDNIKSDAG